MVFHWSLSDSKSPQVSRTLLSILAVLNNAVVWIVSTRPPTSIIIIIINIIIIISNHHTPSSSITFLFLLFVFLLFFLFGVKFIFELMKLDGKRNRPIWFSKRFHFFLT